MNFKYIMNATIIDRFKIFTDNVIGSGSFGTVFLGYDYATQKFVAVKTEKITCELNLLDIEYKILSHRKKSSTMGSLTDSVKTYEKLNISSLFKIKGITETTRTSDLINESNAQFDEYQGIDLMNCYLYTADDTYRYLITDLRGTNLEILMRKGLNYLNKDTNNMKSNNENIPLGKFTIKTVLMLAIQLVDILQYYHSIGIIHRDIKPENFLSDLNLPMKHVYLIDFGLSRKYRKPSPILKKRIGTLRYMSINVHEKKMQGPIDDLWSLGYVLIYFANGYLPWQKIKNKDKIEKFNLVYQLKKQYTADKLAELLNCTCNKPDCNLQKTFKSYFEYLYELNNLNDLPIIDYTKIVKLFWSCMHSHKYAYNYNWIE